MPTLSHKLQHTTLISKLTLLFVSILIATGGAFFAVSSLITRVQLNNQIDHHIHLVIFEAQRIVQTQVGERRLELLRNLVSAQGMTIVLLSADGSAILQTNSNDIAAVSEHQLQQIVLSSSPSESPQHFTVDTIRFASLPVDVNFGRGVLAVGYSTQIISETVQSLLLSLGSTLLIILIFCTFLIFYFLKRLLQPLDQISRTALSISSSETLSTRVEPLPHTQEFHHIATAFNSMLQKLETAFATEQSFFADAAHTLKTPLAVLRSQIETGRESAQKKNKMLHTIDQATETIKQLLFISHIQTHPPSTGNTSISKIVEDLAELAETMTQSTRVKVRMAVEPNLQVVANHTLLSRALGNIVKNAVEHTPKNGVITLTLVKQQDTIVLSISNTGSQILPTEMSKLFDRFFQGANAKKSSSGLGLAIAQAIVYSLNGNIAVTSDLNQTTFTVSLPAL